MDYKDLEIRDKIKEFTIYSIGMFEGRVPTSTIELPQEFIQKIKAYCLDFNHSAVSLPHRFYNCSFCPLEVRDSDLVVSRYSSNRIWLQFDKSIYSFPGILYHLIIVHKYVPPIEFIEAVLSPNSKTVLLFDNDENVTRCNKETMEMLLAAHNSSKDNVESKEIVIGDNKFTLLKKRPLTLKEKVKQFFKRK